ncbi:MAG: glycerol-3-phosphate acyltransferase [Gemmiger sp.]|uniref:glycerol-3-phosphate acyltransferase n=1 Tax=Gemmiger sp. TaxID=2049027 RepID=UPI002A82A52A|nr:glycerol-3-phosphate acyltransferase [Gemmiger sp.]MDY4880373.1 glycerol-3-phosphate acyltransferase [Gemmiger sp.]
MHPNAVLARLLCLLVGYVFGSFLTAEVVARAVAGKSARQLGSGNPGTANITAQLGPKAGLVALAGDLLKTAAACGVGYAAAAPVLGWLSILYAGFGAVLGHNFPLWAKGKGGKGVAVTCAWVFLYLPVTGALCCLAGGAVVLWLGYLPLGAVVIAVLAVPAAWIQQGTESGLILLLNAVIMISRHFRGLKRIASGSEHQFFRRK